MHENVLFSVRDIQKLKFSGSNRRSREGKDDMEFFKIREFFGFKIFHPKLTSLAESFNHTLIESIFVIIFVLVVNYHILIIITDI